MEPLVEEATNGCFSFSYPTASTYTQDFWKSLGFMTSEATTIAI
jgi:hypothetical protein